jgi:hypothetical protein
LPPGGRPENRCATSYLTQDILVSSAGLAIVALFAVTWIRAVIYLEGG